METHIHQVHNPEGKKIKSILFEFLMLFLAVFLGLQAENIREHYSENEKAHILAKSLAEDLRKDTAALHNNVSLSEIKAIAADSIINMLQTLDKPIPDTSFYRNLSPVVSAINFMPTDGTYSQLKASGTLRYFNQSLVNIMNDYVVQLQKTKVRDDIDNQGNWKVADAVIDVINMEVISKVRFNEAIMGKLYINLSTETQKQRLINLIYMNRTLRLKALEEYNKQYKLAKELLALLNKDYQTN